MKYIIFQKKYTRDTTLLLQQFWLETQTRGLKKQLGIIPRYTLTGVDYLTNGVIEVWESKEAITWIKEQLVRLSHRQPEKILQLLENYKEQLKNLYPLWKKGYVSSKNELRTFLKKIEDMMVGDLVLCYLSGDSRTERRIYIMVKKLRAEDHFFASNDLVLRKSLQKLYPKLSSYVTSITKQEVLNKMPSVRECQRRSRHFISTNNGYHAIETLPKYQQHHPHHIFLQDPITPNMIRYGLKGQIAQRGIVRGVVRIVRQKRNMITVKKGDIVVSPMTTPTFFPVLRKAAAIVTDEGGIICHAAIVARELKKPCITGTRVATRLFQNGDVVEVNAIKGIVRKI